MGKRSSEFSEAESAWGRVLLAAAVLVLLQPGICRAQSTPPVVGAIRIEIAGKAGDPEKMARIARGLISLREGEIFSDARFSRSVEALRESGLFETIDVPDPDWSRKKIVLVFRLKPFARIKKITIHGGFPLLEKEIRDAMTIDIGDPCLPEKFPEQEASIRSLFSGQGYIRPRVSLSCEKDPEDGHCTVDVSIDKGRFYRVESVRFFGNREFSSIRLKMRLKTWQSSLLFGGASRFVEKQLDQDIETLRQFYRAKGYAEAQVEAGVEKNPDTGTVRVRVRIAEGPRYRVRFSGNRAFWDLTLKKDLVLFTEGNKNNLGLRRSIRNMEKHYRRAGYLDVRIRAGQQPPPDRGGRVKNIVFTIREGPRYLVESVSVSGNRVFDGETIKKQMLTAPRGTLHEGAYVPETLEEDIRAIKALYVQAGYRNAVVEKSVETVRAPDREKRVDVTVRLRIKEGPQTIVSGISFEGKSPLPPERMAGMTEMKPGTPFRSYLVQADQTAIAAAVSEKGYPHVAVEPAIDISADQTAASVTYAIEPGPFVEMGQAFFTGNFKTRRKVLAREMEIAPGEPFSLSRVLASQRNIRNLPVVDTADFEFFGLAQQAEQVDMLSKIREIRPYFVELAAGYDTRRLFYVNAAAGNRNLLGLNKQVRAGMEWSQIGYRAELNLNEPRFLGTRVAAGSGVFVEKTEELNKDFGTRAHGASLGFSRQLTPRLNGSLNFKFESRQQYSIGGTPATEEADGQFSRRSILSASPGLSYNSTDSFLRPTRGIRASVSLDASRGLDNSLDDFFKYRIDARGYYSPLDRLTLAVRGRIGRIHPYGGNRRVPDDQLFFLGGTADVRGFSENRLRVDENNDPVGGKTALLGSVEARFDLGMNFEAALFLDTGAVRDPLGDAGSGDFRESAGLALRYITAIGPIGGMYGWKLDRKPGESAGAFHFSIGYTF